MIGAVGRLGAQHLHNAAHAALAGGVLAFHHKCARTHAQERAMATAVERERGLLHAVIGGGRTRAQEARANPAHEVFACHIVGAHHNHAAAATIANPVFGHSHGLGGGGAGGVDVRVGSACADVLGKLAVAHGQNAEDEAAVKLIGVAPQFIAQVRQTAVNLAERTGVGCVAAQFLQRGHLRAQVVPPIETAELVGHAVAAWEGAGKDNPRLVAQALGQHPAVRQIGALGGRAVGLYERDIGFAQGVKARGHGQLRGDVKRLHQLGGDPVLGRQVKRAAAPCQLDDVIGVTDALKGAGAVLALDEARNVTACHLLAKALGDEIDELLAAQNAHGVVGVHHRLVGPRQPQPCAGDNYGAGGRLVAVEDLHADGLRCGILRQHLRQRLAEGRCVHVRRYGRTSGRLPSRMGNGCCRCSGSHTCAVALRTLAAIHRCQLHVGAVLLGQAIAGCKEAAERVVEGGKFASLGVVAEERPDLRLVEQHIIHEALERLLGAHLHKGTHAVGVERLQPLDPLHG